ncbi:MAG: putative holin [Undibacterium sp.]|nr:putative holin [Undibacterium sp.]
MKIPRMLDWSIIALALSAIIALFFPHQLPVSLYKLSLISLAGVVGYWLDRSLFPYARPDRFHPSLEEDDEFLTENSSMFDVDCCIQNDLLFVGAQMRRAVIVAAAMIAVSLGA